MNVLSLFDGMSCGQIALNRLGIKYENYFASEIDKWAIKITQKNYPNTIQLGDVQDVKAEDLPKIDLLIGGSPCQGFSSAGTGKGFKDPRSRLFFEYVRLLKELKPRYFLLENVKMKPESIKVITEHLGVEPVYIDSKLVSGQQRQRYYWSNIPGITQPSDKEVYLKHILVDGYVDRQKSFCLDACYYKGGNPQQYFEKSRRQLVFIQGLDGGKRLDDGKELSRNYREGMRIYHINGKSATLTARTKGGKGGYSGLYGWLDADKVYYRKLYPIECERLQTVPDNYTEGVSNTQRYKMLGNGWTVDVICHIFKNMEL